MRKISVPTEEEFDRAGNFGDEVTRTAISRGAVKLAEREPHPAAPIAFGLGAVKAVGEYLRVIAHPDGIAVLERHAQAYLRGALRGCNGPVTEDGRPWTGTLDG